MATPIVTLSCASEFKAYAADALHDTCAVVTIKAEAHKGHEDTRPGLDLLLVLDVSGSMHSVLPLVKKTAQFLVKRAAERDRVAVVSYDDEAKERYPFAFMTQHEKNRAVDCIAHIESGGSTNMDAALRLCARLLTAADAARTPEREAVVLFLTDGKPTTGVTDGAALRSIAREKLPAAATLYTFGYGTDYDAELMEALAKQHKGGYYFIKNEDQVAPTFATCMGGLMSTVAKSIDVRLQMPAGVGLITAVHAPVEVTRDAATGAHEFCLVDLQAGERRDVIVNLALAKRAPEDGPAVLFEATARYYDVVAKELRSATPATLTVLRPAALDSPSVVDPTVDEQRNRVLFVQESERAAGLVAQNKMDEARRVIEAATANLRASATAGSALTRTLIEDLERARSNMKDRSSYESYGYESASYVAVHASQRSQGLSSASQAYRTHSQMNEIAQYVAQPDDDDADDDDNAVDEEPPAKRPRLANDADADT
jgi:Ca-activated chloride channel family protein